MCLVSGDQKYRYFALSYVWGNMVTFQTLKSNLPDLEDDDSILRIKNKLPQVINDAMSLVSTLGERFLWVDALCIVKTMRETSKLTSLIWTLSIIRL